MKKTIGCLSIIGIVVVLSVIGCVAMIGYGISSMPEIPKYATFDNINAQCESDFKIIKSRIIKDKTDTLDKELSKDIYAIYKGDNELLKRYSLNNRSNFMINKAGVGIVRINGNDVQCMTCEINCMNADYVVYIFDNRAASNQSLKGRM